jgi:hypothetical protein
MANQIKKSHQHNEKDAMGLCKFMNYNQLVQVLQQVNEGKKSVPAPMRKALGETIRQRIATREFW